MPSSTMLQKEIQYGDTEVTVEPYEGELEDGELSVRGVEVSSGGSAELVRFDEQVLFDDVEDYLVGHFIDNHQSVEDRLEEEWPDTYDDSWTETKIVSPGTVKWDVLKSIWQNQPTTSGEVKEDMGSDKTPSPYISKLKESNLVAKIAAEDGYHVLVCTHLGAKELYCNDDLDGGDGEGVSPFEEFGQA